MANDIVSEARSRMDLAWDQDRENREDAFSDLRFLSGDQWPEADRLKREAQNRPCLTINRLPQFVNQVANQVRANPPGIKVVPAGTGAEQEVAEIYSGLLRQIQYRSNATNVFADAMYYAVACGIGHFRAVTDYVDDNQFEQEILIKRIKHPLSVFWDPDAVEPTRSDAQYCLVTEMVRRAAFKRRFPDAVVADFDTPDNFNADGGLFWSNRDGVRICEYWVKTPVTRTIARMESGEIIDITNLDKAEIKGLPVQMTRKVRSTKIEQYLLSGDEVLDGPNQWAGRYIPIFPVIGNEIALDTKVIRSGLIRAARDSQVLYNFWRSAAAETIAMAPRAPFLATPSMIAKFKGQWDTQNTVSRPYLLYEPDPDAPGARPQREAPPEIPAALVQESNIASDEMKATTGVYDAALGQRSNETAGIAIQARTRQTDGGTLHYQDNLTATLHHLGIALVDLIPKVYDTQRTLHVLGEDDEPQQVMINMPALDKDGKTIMINDLNAGAYDVRVKIGPSYSTRRQEAASSMVEFMQAVPQAAAVAADLIAANMDWPGAEKIAERLKSMLPPNVRGDEPTPQDAQAQQQNQQFQEAMKQTALQEAQGKAAKVRAEAMRTALEAQALQQQQPAQQGVPGAEHQGALASAHGDALANATAYAKLQQQQAVTAGAWTLAQRRQMENELTQRKLEEPLPTREIP